MRDDARARHPHGPANGHLCRADEPRAALVLGHGAGGGVAAPDLVAVAGAARSEAISVALVEQPYRVAGRRSPAPARQLDAAWQAVIGHLLAHELRGLPLLVGGRPAGARVACRTAAATAAVGSIDPPPCPGCIARRNARRYAVGIPVQLVTRVPDATADAVDHLVRAGVYASRSDAVRAGLDAVVERERRRTIGCAIVDGYRRLPQADDDRSWPDAATSAMIAEEPW